MIPSDFPNRNALFSWLDKYTDLRKEELDQKELSKDVGLLKSYLLETSPNGNEQRISKGLPWKMERIDEGLFHLFGKDEQISLGFLEQLSERHFAFYTPLKTKEIEPHLKNIIFNHSQWDFAWFSGIVLNILWQDYILPLSPHRFTKMTFEYEARFERFGKINDWIEQTSKDDGNTEEDLVEQGENFMERRASVIAITERVNNIQSFLPKLQSIHSPFRSLRTLRLPASEHGGYELWNWGKMTFRSPSFTEGRSNLITLTQMYRDATESIERMAWLYAEKLPAINGLRLKGVPITIKFSETIQQQVFEQFIHSVFGQSRNLFRLWGNPIQRSDSYYYVHAVDLHLWKPIGLELTPSYFRLLLPQGTCGNTVHRLVQNIQRYLVPAIEVFIGDKNYSEIFRQSLQKISIEETR